MDIAKFQLENFKTIAMDTSMFVLLLQRWLHS